MAVDSATPPFFTLPREIRNRIYFWLIADKLDHDKKQRHALGNPTWHKQLHISTHSPGCMDVTRESVAANVLNDASVLTILRTSRLFIIEYFEELAVASALPPAVESRCERVNVYGLGSTDNTHATWFYLLLIELFLRMITPTVPLVVVHCKLRTKESTYTQVKCHFQEHGAKKTTSFEARRKVAGVQKMAIRGTRSYTTNWYGQSLVLAGTLNDFLRPELKLSH